MTSFVLNSWPHCLHFTHKCSLPIAIGVVRQVDLDVGPAPYCLVVFPKQRLRKLRIGCRSGKEGLRLQAGGLGRLDHTHDLLAVADQAAHRGDEIICGAGTLQEELHRRHPARVHLLDEIRIAFELVRIPAEVFQDFEINRKLGGHRIACYSNRSMPFLTDQDVALVRKRFEKELDDPVTLEFFTPSTGGLVIPGQDSEMAEYTRQILVEVAALSPRITLNVHSLATEPESARAFGVTRTPATAVIGAQDFGIRYFGIPGGYEFSTLLDLIIAVSQAQPPIAVESHEILSRLKTDAHIQVFVTPT